MATLLCPAQAAVNGCRSASETTPPQVHAFLFHAGFSSAGLPCSLRENPSSGTVPAAFLTNVDSKAYESRMLGILSFREPALPTLTFAVDRDRRLRGPTMRVGLLAALLVAGCAIDTPSIVKRTAINSLPSEVAKTLYEPVRTYEGLRVICGRKHRLSREDEASGIAEQWCVVVVGRVLGSLAVPNKWVDCNYTIIVVRAAGTDTWGATLPRGRPCPCP